MPRVILTLMVRNEAAIIGRCIETAMRCPAVTLDAVCLCDTGSDDNTVEVVRELMATKTIPLGVFTSEWQNFGHNRTLSFIACQELCTSLDWPLEDTYALVLDADMKLCGANEKNISLFSGPPNLAGHQVQQSCGYIQYPNTRFLLLSVPWRCTGVTHEFWDGAATTPLDKTLIWIDDIGDGGCKADKFERDERLLVKGLRDEPGNVRYMFYLAQTLKDLKRLPEAIAMYKRRVRAGSWFQEQWYSAYQLSRLYLELGDMVRMEYWGLRASGIDGERAENLYFLSSVFREKGRHHKAWYYMQEGIGMAKPNDRLFLEGRIYDSSFHYEKTILNYYIQPLRRPESLRDLVVFCNRFDDRAYINLCHYVDPVPGKLWQHELSLPDIGDYVASSTSFVVNSDKSILANVRYVNYRIRADGSYDVRGPNVHTRNVAYRSLDFRGFREPVEMVVDSACVPAIDTKPYIMGIEDLRLGPRVGDLQPFIGASMEYSGNNTVQQVSGQYSPGDGRLYDIQPLQSPRGMSCEKNWVHLPEAGKYIYCWHPLDIGVLALPGTLTILGSQETPKFFSNIRGSSNVVEHQGFLYCVVHLVQFLTPRKYYHMIVKMDAEAPHSLRSYSNPFYFLSNAIEYVLACSVHSDEQGRSVLTTIVSQNDANPVALCVDLALVTFFEV